MGITLAARAGIVAPKSVTVAITSDRGLCGGLNSNITKYTRALLRLTEPSSEQRGPLGQGRRARRTAAGRSVGGPATTLHGTAAVRQEVRHLHGPAPCHTCRAADTAGAKVTVATIGDKGRSQLTRTEGKLYTLGIADTYKLRVTFAQVRGRRSRPHGAGARPRRAQRAAGRRGKRSGSRCASLPSAERSAGAFWRAWLRARRRRSLPRSCSRTTPTWCASSTTSSGRPSRSSPPWPPCCCPR